MFTIVAEGSEEYAGTPAAQPGRADHTHVVA